jgi:hypothetical protein
MAAHATDHERVTALLAAVRDVEARRDEAEEAWLATAELADGA